MFFAPDWYGDKDGEKRSFKREVIFTVESPSSAQQSSSLQIFDTCVSGRKYWRVEWKIVHNEGGVSGYVLLTKEELEVAFGLSDINRVPSNAEHLLIHLGGGDRIRPGKFIGAGDRLNFPGPGTGRPGDLNFSFRVTEPMQNKVRNLIDGKK